MAQGLDILSVARINGAMQALVDVRTLPRPLRFLNRTAVVPALDEEVMIVVRDYVLAADLIATGQKAAVYESDKFALVGQAIPNIKIGRKFDEARLRLLYNIQATGGMANDRKLFGDYVNRTLANNLLGIQQRENALIAAMWVDDLIYSRNGITITGGTWGMPADIKTTVAITWDNPATAKPITDLLLIKQYGQQRYGENWNRVTMGLTTFTYMIKTAEFQSMIRFVIPPGLTASIIPVENVEYMKAAAANLLGMMIELEDDRYWTQGSDGSLTQARYFPINQVALSDSNDDENAGVMDFANTVVSESLVGTMAPSAQEGVIGTFTEPLYGPVGYATAGHNPPEMHLWGVARGFPRKKRFSATAVLTVGAWSDMIPTTEPAFPY